MQVIAITKAVCYAAYIVIVLYVIKGELLLENSFRAPVSRAPGIPLFHSQFPGNENG